MKNNNNGVFLVAGLGIAGYFLFAKKTAVVNGISGTINRRAVIKNYLNAIGLPEGNKKMESLWAKMSAQEIILDAFRNGILIVGENSVLRNLIYEKYNFNLGLEKHDSAYNQNIIRWKKMSLKTIIADAQRHGIRLLDPTIYKDKKGSRSYPQTQANAYSDFDSDPEFDY